MTTGHQSTGCIISDTRIFSVVRNVGHKIALKIQLYFTHKEKEAKSD